MSQRNIKQSSLIANVFFVTLKTIKGVRIFTNEKYFNVLLNSLLYCQKHKGLKLYAYCLLVNHLHLVFSTESNHPEKFLQDFKRFTTTQIHKVLKESQRLDDLNKLSYSAINRKNTDFRLWQRAVFPEEIFTQKFLEQKIKYTDFNPTHHQVVSDIEHYPYTSYHNHYCAHKNFLSVLQIPSIL